MKSSKFWQVYLVNLLELFFILKTCFINISHHIKVLDIKSYYIHDCEILRSKFLSHNFAVFHKICLSIFIVENNKILLEN